MPNHIYSVVGAINALVSPYALFIFLGMMLYMLRLNKVLRIPNREEPIFNSHVKSIGNRVGLASFLVAILINVLVIPDLPQNEGIAFGIVMLIGFPIATVATYYLVIGITVQRKDEPS